MGYTVGDGEIAIVLRPILDDEGEWTGSISTGLIFGKEKAIHGQRAALDLALTLVVAQTFLDEYPDWEDVWDDYRGQLLQDLFPEAWAEANEEYAEQTSKETYSGNVVKLEAWTKTKGNA